MRPADGQECPTQVTSQNGDVESYFSGSSGLTAHFPKLATSEAQKPRPVRGDVEAVQ